MWDMGSFSACKESVVMYCSLYTHQIDCLNEGLVSPALIKKKKKKKENNFWIWKKFLTFCSHHSQKWLSMWNANYDFPVTIEIGNISIYCHLLVYNLFSKLNRAFAVYLWHMECLAIIFEVKSLCCYQSVLWSVWSSSGSLSLYHCWQHVWLQIEGLPF